LVVAIGASTQKQQQLKQLLHNKLGCGHQRVKPLTASLEQQLIARLKSKFQ